jgi:ABC-type transport system involved in multi-copper enzyme maturation permease subunit
MTKGIPTMSSKAITEKPETHAPDDWHPPPERAPSLIREEEPTLARWVGMVGLFFLCIGAILLVIQSWGMTARFGPIPLGPAATILFLVIGLSGMLYHAAADRDQQIRRTYAVFGGLCLVAAAVVTALPIGGPAGRQFLPYGYCCLWVGMAFLGTFIRNETEASWRNPVLYLLGGLGLLLALTGLIGGNVSEDFLLPSGVLLALLGLAYVWTFIGLEGTSGDRGYWGAVALAVTGVAFFLVALGRSVLPPLFHSLGWMRAYGWHYFQSSGFVLMVLGLVYAGVAASLSSDNRFFVLFRRELAAYFYSPIAYIVLFAFVGMSWLQFAIFVNQTAQNAERGVASVEPIVHDYVWSLLPVLATLVVVPILTMRLLSEEKRAGTWEVLLTAPVGETTVVLSKFFAAWVFFMILWIPAGLFLVPLRVEGGQPFDYYPLLGFFVALLISGAEFVAMGLFFSSLTRNQIAAAILTVLGMLLLLGVWVVSFYAPQGGKWHTVLKYLSFADLWSDSLTGRLVLKNLMFPLSAAVFWVFLTVKVLEARKWK